ncbi:hypothetical protein, partial [Rubritalea sp.]|uniref:hypothetical protein n=1 Tax=Rubritalea sp. TaxID=2109375 RepID=UPI003EF8427E
GPVRVGRRQVICPLLANAGSGLFLCPDSSHSKAVGGERKKCEANGLRRDEGRNVSGLQSKVW